MSRQVQSRGVGTMHRVLIAVAGAVLLMFSTNVYAAHNDFTKVPESNKEQFQSCLSSIPFHSPNKNQVTDIEEFVPGKEFIFHAVWEHMPEPVRVVVVERPYSDNVGTWVVVEEVHVTKEKRHMDGAFVFHLGDFGVVPYEKEKEPLCPTDKCWNTCNWADRIDAEE